MASTTMAIPFWIRIFWKTFSQNLDLALDG